MKVQVEPSADFPGVTPPPPPRATDPWGPRETPLLEPPCSLLPVPPSSTPDQVVLRLHDFSSTPPQNQPLPSARSFDIRTRWRPSFP